LPQNLQNEPPAKGKNRTNILSLNGLRRRVNTPTTIASLRRDLITLRLPTTGNYDHLPTLFGSRGVSIITGQGNSYLRNKIDEASVFTRDPFESPEPSTAPPIAIAERLIAFVVGPLVLLVLAIMIVMSRSGWMTVLDAFFFFAVVMMIWSRWAEIRSGYARTVYDEPATTVNFLRYVAVILPVALAVWLVASLFGKVF
jgi:hypothetical protein